MFTRNRIGIPCPTTPSSTLELGSYNGGVVTAETERVVHDGVDLHLARLVRNVVEVTFRIGMLVIDRRGHDVVFDGLDAGNGFHRTRRAEHVAGCALG